MNKIIPIKKTTILNITVAAIALIFISEPSRLIGQTVSYSQTVTLIGTFDKEKQYVESTTGPILDLIIQGMIDNDGVYLAEGLKWRLVGNISSTRVKNGAAAAEYPDDGKLLELLFYTGQSVPAFITDADLRSRVGGIKGNGTAIKKSVESFWKNKDITTNLIECLEGYPPETAAVLVDVISRTWYSGVAKIYENTDVSWASESLWAIYHDVREVELAKRSVVVKLLAENGYIEIPTVTYAEFIWSQGEYGYAKWPDIAIDLDPVTWSEADVPDLQRLLGNPYYRSFAQSLLTNMGY
jgi:hypothetical protein